VPQLLTPNQQQVFLTLKHCDSRAQLPRFKSHRDRRQTIRTKICSTKSLFSHRRFGKGLDAGERSRATLHACSRSDTRYPRLAKTSRTSVPVSEYAPPETKT